MTKLTIFLNLPQHPEKYAITSERAISDAGTPSRIDQHIFLDVLAKFKKIVNFVTILP